MWWLEIINYFSHSDHQHYSITLAVTDDSAHYTPGEFFVVVVSASYIHEISLSIKLHVLVRDKW